MLRTLDDIWVRAARELGFPVTRGGDAYVHWNGGALQIAPDDELDADDSLAQLVLHEICHYLVEGKGARSRPDWGLDNTSERDLVREHACLRLQAHLTAPHGLRG